MNINKQVAFAQQVSRRNLHRSLVHSSFSSLKSIYSFHISALKSRRLIMAETLAAPLIFIIVMAFQYASWWLEKLKKNASKTEKAMQLHAEIKQLLREAATLSQPSTFAQAAKLRRQAAAKEKELANYQDLHGKEVKLSYDLYLKVLFNSEVFAYVVLILWFWRAPVAIISQQLVQPSGGLLSWMSGGVQNNNVMVGIVPWLIVSYRVSKFICRLFKQRNGVS